MADIIATRRVLQSTMDQIVSDRAHLRSLAIKLSNTLGTLRRAHAAYRDSIQFIGPMPTHRAAQDIADEG